MEKVLYKVPFSLIMRKDPAQTITRRSVLLTVVQIVFSKMRTDPAQGNGLRQDGLPERAERITDSKEKVIT